MYRVCCVSYGPSQPDSVMPVRLGSSNCLSLHFWLTSVPGTVRSNALA